MVVTVTWVDGSQEDYRCEDYRVEGHVLYLIPPRSGLDPQPKRSIPLDNVRIWTE